MRCARDAWCGIPRWSLVGCRAEGNVPRPIAHAPPEDPAGRVSASATIPRAPYGAADAAVIVKACDALPPDVMVTVTGGAGFAVNVTPDGPVMSR